MRVAGITLLIQAGVPLEIVSKFIAGHSSLFMTIYYNHLSPANINRSLQEGRIQIEAEKTNAALIELRNLSFEEVKMRTVSSHPDALKNAMPENGGDRILWSNRTLGICPWEGSRCNDGGERIKQAIRKDGVDKSIYAAVPGGADSCVMCRHFLTGPEWKDALRGYCTLLSRRLTRTSRDLNRAMDDSREIRLILLKVVRGSTEQERLKWKLKQNEQLVHDINERQRLVAKCLVEARVLLAQIDNMTRDNITTREDGRRSLIAKPNESLDEWLTISEFEQVAFLRKYGMVYKGFRDQESEDTCKRIADEIMIKSGYLPISMARESPTNEERAYDRVIDHLLENVSRENLDALTYSSLSLEDLTLVSDASKRLFAAPFESKPRELPVTQEQPDHLIESFYAQA